MKMTSSKIQALRLSKYICNTYRLTDLKILPLFHYFSISPLSRLIPP
jgi:hypothetical protein